VTTLTTHQTDVVIVGGGPTGLTAAYLLARYGIRSVIIERRATPSAHPRAHMISTRSMELFDTWGISQYVLDNAYPMEWEPFAMLVMLGALTPEEQMEISPGRQMSCAQDRVEEGLLGLVTSQPGVETLWNHAVVGFTDHGDRVAVQAEGNDGIVEVEGRWMIASDGANSTVRSILGVEMVGDPHVGSLINVYFDGDIMRDGERPPLVSASRNKDIHAAFISMDGYRRWTFNVFYDPTKESVADYPAERCAELIRTAWNAPIDAPIEVHGQRPWTMTTLVADKFRVGSVFLAGDAAHAFPPTGGFGMNSGIQDAHNLAWKLHEVMQGRGGPALLDSYEAERRPVACLNAIQSLQNADRSDNTGTTVTGAEALAAAATKSVRSGSLSEEDEEERQRLEILEHGAAIGMDIGFAYDESAVIVDDGSTRPDTLVTSYIPNACPGARAPHMYVDHHGVPKSLIAVFDGEMTVMVGPNGQEAWQRAVNDQIGNDQLRLAVVGPGCEYVAAAGAMESLYGLEANGAVLVRPDGHVAYRASRLPDDPSGELSAALATALGHPSPSMAA
jgi:putative polyketide hydroxylase